MNTQALLRSLLLAAAVLLVLSGCSNAKPPKEAVQTSLTKSSEMKSYTYTGSLAINELNIPAELLQGNEGMLEMVKNASVTVEGAYQADPMQMDMNMKIALKGDLAFELQVPMIITPDKIYVKVPNIPGYNLGEAAGKYVVIDPKELQKQQGIQAPTLDVATQRQMLKDVSEIVLKHFDEETYFSEPKAADVTGLPEGLKPDKIVKFSVTPDNFDQTVTTLVNNVAPEIIDLLLKNESYRNALQLKEADLQKAKEELAGSEESELKADIEAFKKDVKVNELSLTGAIKDNYMVYQEGVVNLDVIKDGQTAKIGLLLKGSYDNINEKVTLMSIPTETITIEELMGSVMGQSMPEAS